MFQTHSHTLGGITTPTDHNRLHGKVHSKIYIPSLLFSLPLSNVDPCILEDEWVSVGKSLLLHALEKLLSLTLLLGISLSKIYFNYNIYRRKFNIILKTFTISQIYGCSITTYPVHRYKRKPIKMSFIGG